VIEDTNVRYQVCPAEAGRCDGDRRRPLPAPWRRQALPLTINAISAASSRYAWRARPRAPPLDTVEPITSHALPNVPGKRITIVRVLMPWRIHPCAPACGLGHRYITKAKSVRNWGGPVETFKVGQSSSSAGRDGTWSRPMQQHRAGRV